MKTSNLTTNISHALIRSQTSIFKKKKWMFSIFNFTERQLYQKKFIPIVVNRAYSQEALIHLLKIQHNDTTGQNLQI